MIGQVQTVNGQKVVMPLSGVGDVQTMFDIVHPVGEVYIQYPTCENPNSLYSRGGVTCTWTDITANYNGAFFRAYKNGTSGSFYDNNETLGAVQASQNKSHNHGTGNTPNATAGANASITSPATTTQFPTQSWSKATDYTDIMEGYFGMDDGDQSVPVNGFVKYGTGKYSGGGSVDDLNYNSNGYMCFTHRHHITQSPHSHTIYAEGGTEARPDNYSIKIWKRTA